MTLNRDEIDSLPLGEVAKRTGVEPPKRLPLAGLALAAAALVLFRPRLLVSLLALYGAAGFVVNRQRGREYRERAWKSYRLDLTVESEYGTARQGDMVR